jgi:predicted transcriptional regulator
MTTSEMYGYPYYNQKKPKSYLINQCAARLNFIDKQIKELEQERAEVEKKLNEYLKK